MSLSQEGILLNDSETEIVRQDKIATCKRWGLKKFDFNVLEIIKRHVMLHTLHHGTTTIVAIDFKCSKCGRFVSYDGAYDALFSVRKEHVFTHELLDAWLWDVCGTGCTFRDAFYSWSAKNNMWSASLKRVGKE